MKMGVKVSSAEWRPFCLGLNVLNAKGTYVPRIWTYKIRYGFTVNSDFRSEMRPNSDKNRNSRYDMSISYMLFDDLNRFDKNKH